MSRAIRAKQKLGKFRIERKIAEGGFATVWRALDTIEGIRVALKIPYAHLVGPTVLDGFKEEVRLTAKLDHPNILGLKSADFVDGHFVLAFPLGERSLSDRLGRRLGLRTALGFAEQMLDALAHAHERKVIHCDVKPDNLILFDGGRLRLTDFGIAKIALRTVDASGSGTLGYVAPEQAMGKPSARSDVFSAGLVIYRMVSGVLPEWPYEWPLRGHDRVRKLHPDFVAVLKRSLEVDPKRRYRDAAQFLAAFRKVKAKALRHSSGTRSNGTVRARADWKAIRHREFRRRFGRLLDTKHTCARCEGPVSEAMTTCPWCGASRKTFDGETSFPIACPRCHRGMKLDWKYCPWCFGAGFEPHGSRQYDDRRYTHRCASPLCPRKDLMPFMRYCPWCRRKVRRTWRIEGVKDTCRSCGWGVLPVYWSHCPWCAKTIG